MMGVESVHIYSKTWWGEYSWTLIKSHCDSWNPITGFGGRGPGFEVSFWRLDVLLSWCLSCLITMMGVESVHIYSKTWWGQFRVMDDAGIILVSDSSTELSNTLLSHAESLNNWLGSFCIIFGGRLRTKMTIALTWIGQCSWVSNNFYITIESMNIPPCVDSLFSVVVKDCDDICHLGRNECFDFVAIWQCLHVLEEKSCRRYSFSREDNFLLKYEDYDMKIFKLFSVLEYQGGQVRLNITIHPSNMRGKRMEKSV